MTHYLERPDGKIAYDLDGQGPLVVLVPGLADTRAAYRHMVPLLVDAGFRVAACDLRGHGESSTGWPSYTRTDTAADIAALIEHLGGPAIAVGQSFAGGAVTILAASRPELVRGIVEIGTFTRTPQFNFGAFLRNDHNYRFGALALGAFALTGKPAAWLRYLDLAYPGVKPNDWDSWRADIAHSLSDPERVKAARKMIQSAPKAAQAALKDVQCPALIVMGTHDSDFADPAAEGAGIVATLPTGLGRLVMVEGAGHYPHAQMPAIVTEQIVQWAASIPTVTDASGQ